MQAPSVTTTAAPALRRVGVALAALLLSWSVVAIPAHASEARAEKPQRVTDDALRTSSASADALEGSSQGGVGTASHGGMHFNWRISSNHWGPSSGSPRIQHAFARTWRSQGSGGYKTHAHAALMYSNAGRTFWETPIYSMHTHGCASVTRTSATSETCASAIWTTVDRLWYNTSSHHWANHTGSGWTSQHNILNQWYDCAIYDGNICRSVTQPL